MQKRLLAPAGLHATTLQSRADIPSVPPDMGPPTRQEISQMFLASPKRGRLGCFDTTTVEWGDGNTMLELSFIRDQS
jgi:hypothetical protein